MGVSHYPIRDQSHILGDGSVQWHWKQLFSTVDLACNQALANREHERYAWNPLTNTDKGFVGR